MIFFTTFLRWLGTFSIGYFGNDIVSLVGDVAPPLKKKDGTGITWWGIVLILAVISLVFVGFLYLLNSFLPKKKRS